MALSREQWEAHKAKRVERLESKADKAEAESQAQYERSRKIVEHIPLGQPILVGHHSERGHRRDLDRAAKAMDKSCAEAKRARDYRTKAEAAEANRAIDSRDPDALEKLEAKRSALEAERERCKAENAAWRKAGKPGTEEADKPKWKALCEALGEERGLAMLRNLVVMPYHKQPWPAYHLQNLGSEIRRLTKRAEALERKASEPEAEPIELENGVEIEESADWDSISIHFPGKPSESLRADLKASGFRWSRQRSAWSRRGLNATSRSLAESLASRYE